MKRSLDEHADRFDEQAADYDASETPEYRRCRDLVIERAAVGADDVVLDLGTGTGAIALELATDAAAVVGRDISEGMLEVAAEKAAARSIENVEFGRGRFLEPNHDGPVDVITSNFAMHHLDDERKRRAIGELTARYEPKRVVLGDVMFFGRPDPDEPYYNPEVDDPATVGRLVAAFTAAGYAVVAVDEVHEQVGVITAEPR